MTQGKKEFIRTIKFVLFSISAGVIQLGSCAVLVAIIGEEQYWISYLISLVLSVLWNFTLNRKFTFYSANNIPVAMMKVSAFYLVFTPLSTWWTAALTSEQVGWHWLAVQISTMLVNFVTEYLYDRFIVFGKTIDTAKQKND